MSAREHPLEGKPVVAMTYADDDREIPAREVAGDLQAYWLESYGRFQCFVSDTMVNPATVREAGESGEGDDVQRAGRFREEDHPRDHGQFSSKPGGSGGGTGEAAGRDRPASEYDRKPGAGYDRKPDRPKPPPVSDEDLDALHAALPPAAQKPSAWERAKKAFLLAYDVVFATATELAAKLDKYAPDVLDTAEDYSKIAYARHTDTSSAAHDPFAEHLGIGADTVAVLVSHAVGYAAGLLRKKSEVAKAEAAGPSPEDVAAAVADVLNAVHEAMGVELRIDPADVLAWLAEREAVHGE